MAGYNGIAEAWPRSLCMARDLGYLCPALVLAILRLADLHRSIYIQHALAKKPLISLSTTAMTHTPSRLYVIRLFAPLKHRGSNSRESPVAHSLRQGRNDRIGRQRSVRLK